MKNKTDENITNITTWGDPKTWVESQYGNITYEQWCEKEIARIHENGGQAEMVRLNGQVCVARPKSEQRTNMKKTNTEVKTDNTKVL
jgi:hypothetical protein